MGRVQTMLFETEIPSQLSPQVHKKTLYIGFLMLPKSEERVNLTNTLQVVKGFSRSD